MRIEKIVRCLEDGFLGVHCGRSPAPSAAVKAV